MKTRIAIVVIALILCGGMWVYAPFHEATLADPGPIYSLMWQAPESIDEGGMTVDWVVLKSEWAIVALVAVVSLLACERWERQMKQLKLVLTGAAIATVYVLIYPPSIGGGPLGIHQGRDWVFHHSRGYEIWLDRRDDELIVILLATASLVGAVRTKHWAAARRGRMTHQGTA